MTAWQRIQTCFDRAASDYRQLAVAQEQLGQLIWQRRPATATRIVDLGCGPGHWSAALQSAYPQAAVMGVDLSEGMLRQARQDYPHLHWVQANAARLPFAKESQELIFSNLAVQWCCHFPGFFDQLQRLLVPGGRALMTSLLPGSLEEIDQAWRQAGLASRVLPFMPLQAYQGLLEAAGFAGIHLEASRQVFYYPSSRELLKSVSGVGASGTPGRLRRENYRRVHQQLEARRTEQGLPLTYQVLIMELSA
ncbi:methyltransferase domain-containing protein [Marinospirillum perlucidum]|uniref:methyltransferase domain-containing protein n=1 Tax=Marinospirillum perlucidum TaxID=1982602 RepID=UPI000DF2F673|nr:methyltransferase domain-containing protein [Marinospirillum perlucidum]